MPRLFHLAFLIFLALGPAAANGVYRPPMAVMEEPTIPMQTAFIRHDGGVETLLVESVAEVGEGETFAWILPLPAEPTSIEPAEPSSLATLRARIAPNVVSRAEYEWIIPLFLLLLFSIGFAERPWWRFRKSPPRVPMLYVACYMTLLCIALTITGLRLLGRGDSRSFTAPVEIVRREPVGNYDVTVLRAADGKELDNWLRDNAYAGMEDHHAEALDYYTQNKWVFLAMKLRRVARKPLVPHPLKVVFPTPHPIFPMRLTAAPGQKTDVAVFLAGPIPYSHPHLRTISRTRVSIDQGWRPGFFRRNFSPFVLTEMRNPVENQEVVGLMESGDWLTRLQGTLGKGEMKEDIIPIPLSSDASRKVLRMYTAPVVRWRVFMTVSTLALLLFPVVSSLAARRKLHRRLLMVLLLIPLFGGAVVYAFHEPAKGVRVLERGESLPE